MGQQSGAGYILASIFCTQHIYAYFVIVVIKAFWYKWKSKPLASFMSPLPILLRIGSGQHPTPRLPMNGLKSMHLMGLWLPRKEEGGVWGLILGDLLLPM